MEYQYRTLNPTTEELIETHDPPSGEAIEKALQMAEAGFDTWRWSGLPERRNLLLEMAGRLEERATELAELLALEMGKPVAEGESEAQKCAWACRYYAEQSEEFLQPTPHTSDGSSAYVRYDPLGPILAIMPWNFPLWQVYRFMAPALTAGNVVLLKHAPSVPRSALAIAEITEQAGAPEGVFQNLFLTNEQAASVISDPRVRGVTLTGSCRAGREVGAAAGAHLKTMVMELGGSDPFIVFEDADLDEAAEVGASSRCINSGQSCIAAKRFLVAAPVLDDFTSRLSRELGKRKVGDPLDRSVDIGPLAREDLRDKLASQVSDSVREGATILYQGTTPERGFFYPPTILTGIEPETPARDEELFGPVAVVMHFANEDHAVRLANETAFGLGSSVWTESGERAERLIPRIEAGSVFVNGLVKSDPRLPFGGVKDSGFGRELGRDGLLEWVNRKTVWIK